MMLPRLSIITWAASKYFPDIVLKAALVRAFTSVSMNFVPLSNLLSSGFMLSDISFTLLPSIRPALMPLMASSSHLKCWCLVMARFRPWFAAFWAIISAADAVLNTLDICSSCRVFMAFWQACKVFMPWVRPVLTAVVKPEIRACSISILSCKSRAQAALWLAKLPTKPEVNPATTVLVRLSVLLPPKTLKPMPNMELKEPKPPARPPAVASVPIIPAVSTEATTTTTATIILENRLGFSAGNGGGVR